MYSVAQWLSQTSLDEQVSGSIAGTLVREFHFVKQLGGVEELYRPVVNKISV